MFKMLLTLVLFVVSASAFTDYTVKNEQVLVNPNELIKIDKNFTSYYNLVKEDFESMITDKNNYLENLVKENDKASLKSFHKKLMFIKNNVTLVVNFNRGDTGDVTSNIEFTNKKPKIIINIPISINEFDEDMLSPFIYNVTYEMYDRIIFLLLTKPDIIK